MKPLKFLVGVLLLAAGAAGLIFSLAAILAVHSASASLSRQTENILDSTAEAVTFLKGGAGKMHGLLNGANDRVKSLDVTLANIDEKIRSSPSGKTFLDQLDADIAVRLQRAQTSITSLQTTMQGFHNTLVLFNSFPGFSSKETAEEGKEDESQELSRSLMEASEMLDQVSRFLDEVLTDREVTQKSLTEVRHLVKQIQGKLSDAQERVAAFESRLVVTEERVQSSQETVPYWINQGSFFATLFLVCFAFTQIGLILQALSLFRSCRDKEENPE